MHQGFGVSELSQWKVLRGHRLTGHRSPAGVDQHEALQSSELDPSIA